MGAEYVNPNLSPPLLPASPLLYSHVKIKPCRMVDPHERRLGEILTDEYFSLIIVDRGILAQNGY